MPFLDFTLAYPIPPLLDPDHVVRTLHAYHPLITPNPYLVAYHRRPVVLAEILDDPFFRDDGHALAAFEVVDRIVLVPGLAAVGATKQVVIPCVMQRFAGGLRCRSLAAGGVRVWSTWRVLPATHATALAADTHEKEKEKQAKNSRSRRSRTAPAPAPAPAPTLPDSPPATPPKETDLDNDGSSASASSFVLVEEARVECGALVKPFVGHSFKSAHLEILRKVISEILLERT